MKELSKFIQEKLHVSSYKKDKTTISQLLKKENFDPKKELVYDVVSLCDYLKEAGYRVNSHIKFGLGNYFVNDFYLISSENIARNVKNDKIRDFFVVKKIKSGNNPDIKFINEINYSKAPSKIGATTKIYVYEYHKHPFAIIDCKIPISDFLGFIIPTDFIL